MPATIHEQAGDLLSRAGHRLAEAEAEVRDAIAGLNQAIDAAHAAGISPRYARAMVNSSAHLGSLGRAYFNREIRSWNDIYESGPRPVNENDSELLDLHARPRPQAPAFSADWERSVPGMLARAGHVLARAETGYDAAYARFSDASDFAQYARIPADQATNLVTALSGPLGDISSGLVAAEVDDWDASITLDLASEFADGTEPPSFWTAAADARAAKGTGDYRAAAASWTLARDQLPSGHLIRDGLDSLISALLTASGTGQHVARAGYIVHHSTEPPSPWSDGQLVEAVRRHAAGLGDDKQALRKVLDGWTDGAIAAAFDAARDSDEAVARACLFATFERAGQLGAQTLQAALAEAVEVRAGEVNRDARSFVRQAPARASGTGPVAAQLQTAEEAAGKTIWTARTQGQLVAALARRGWSRETVRDACHRAYRDGSATTMNNAGDLAAFVTFGNTEVDLWDAEIKPGGDPEEIRTTIAITCLYSNDVADRSGWLKFSGASLSDALDALRAHYGVEFTNPVVLLDDDGAVEREVKVFGGQPESGNPAAAQGGREYITAATSPAGEFPYPLCPAAPETGPKAMKAAGPRPGQQVPPRARGRVQ